MSKSHKSALTRRAFTRLAATVPLVAGALFATQALAAENWSLYIHQAAPQFTTSLGAKQLVENVATATNGDLKIQLHLAGTLQIAPTDITQAVSDNIVQMGDDMFFAGNVPIGGLMRLPFVIQSHEDFLKASPDMLPYVTEGYATKGIKVLGTYDYPMTFVWSREEVTSLEDLKGKKIRVPSPEIGALMQVMGATPVSLPSSEVTVALDRGVVDAVVTGVLGAVLWKDLLSYGYLLPTGSINVYYIVNAEAYNSLSPELQKSLQETVDDAMVEIMAANLNLANNGQKDLEASGKMTITLPTDAELKAAEKASVDIWNKWAEQTGPQAVEALAKVRATLGR